jgi:nucleotide-binding universal stress UspA family protein
MGGILCAIRGGPRSRATIAEAIALAREINHPLYWLYVVNLDSIPCSGGRRTSLLLERMRQLGESVLLGAREMATAQGIVAEHRVRSGNVGREISGLCNELDADYLIVGQPEKHNEDNVFTLARLAGLANSVQKQSGVRVIQPRDRLTSERFRRMMSRVPMTSFHYGRRTGSREGYLQRHRHA